MMWQWNDTIWHRTENFWCAFERPGMPFTRPGNVSIGTRYGVMYFFPDAPFYLYEMYKADEPHAFEGWYCNINLPPERTNDGYSFIDLDLDIWLYPDLHYEILDEDEYRENAVKHKYPAEYMQLAEQTLKELCERIAHLEFPFRANVKTLEPELEFLAQRFGMTRINLESLVSNLSNVT